MAQKTAVDWFIEKAFDEKFLWVTDKPEMVELNSIIEQSKQIEKEQKMKFAADFFRWWWNQKGSNTDEAVKQYYNETHGGNQ